MRAAVDGNAAAGAGELESPRARLGGVHVERIVEAGARRDHRADFAAINERAGFAHIRPVLRLLGHHEDGAGPVPPP